MCSCSMLYCFVQGTLSSVATCRNRRGYLTGRGCCRPLFRRSYTSHWQTFTSELPLFMLLLHNAYNIPIQDGHALAKQRCAKKVRYLVRDSLKGTIYIVLLKPAQRPGKEARLMVCTLQTNRLAPYPGDVLRCNSSSPSDGLRPRCTVCTVR